jgi:hypothetical protein
MSFTAESCRNPKRQKLHRRYSKKLSIKQLGLNQRPPGLEAVVLGAD